MDRQRVLLAGTRLKGPAATWFRQEVAGPSIQSIKWTFEEVVTGLFQRFITEATAQKAVDTYYSVTFTRAKGVLGFWNELVQAAEQMVSPPDNASIKRRFVDHLPDELVKTMCHTRGVNVETATAEQVIEAAQQVEAAEYYLSSWKRGGRAAGSSSVTVNKPVEDSTQKQGNKSRFVRLRPFNRPKEGFKLPYVPKVVNRLPLPKGPTRPMPAMGGQAWKRPQQGGSGNNNNTGIVCYNCDKPGHIAPNCPYPRRERDAKASGEHAKLRAYALKVESVHEEEDVEKVAEETETGVDEPAMPPLDEPESSSEDEIQYEDGEEEIFLLEDLEEGEEPLENEETLNALRMEGEGDLDYEESCHIIAVRPTWEEEVQPSRSRVYRMGLTRPVLSQEARQCIALWTELDGKVAYTLIDTGSTTDMVSPAFARVMGLEVFQLQKQLALQLGCAGSRSAIVDGTYTPIRVGKTHGKIHYFDVANIDRYNVVLGIPFAHQYNVVIDVRERTLYLGGLKGEKIKGLSIDEEIALLRTRRALFADKGEDTPKEGKAQRPLVGKKVRVELIPDGMANTVESPNKEGTPEQ
jgi:hypothetical protein